MFRLPSLGKLAWVIFPELVPLPDDAIVYPRSASRHRVGFGQPSGERFRRTEPGSSHLDTQSLECELVAGIAGHDDSAFRSAIDLHGSAVLRSAMYKLGDTHLAEDVMQSVFIGLWQTPAKFNSGRGSLRSFLLAQCHGKCVDIIRARNRRAARETKVSRMTVPSPVPIDHAVMLEIAATEVHRALALLPRAEREVIELAFYGGHTYRRVAVLLGLPEGTVKARIRSALSRLHNTLCREPLDEESVLASPA